MVKETRVIFDTSDIRQVRFICKCGAEMSHPYIKRHFSNPPQRCPSCAEEWWNPSELNSRPKIQHMLDPIRALHFLTNSGSDDEPNFRLSFEIDGETED